MLGSNVPPTLTSLQCQKLSVVCQKVRLVNNLDEIPFMSIHDLSKVVEVSVASIVRFAQGIGFSGCKTGPGP